MDYERFEFEQPRYGGVNVLRFGDAMVDTGHVAPVSREAVGEALRSGGLAGVERVVHTHPHVDHVGGSQTLDALADLPHVVPAGQTDILHGYVDYLRRARAEMTQLLAGFGLGEATWDEYFPIAEYHEERIEVVRELTDGEWLTLGGTELEVLETPGHAEPHVAFWHEPSGTLFSGDLVDPDGRFQYGPLLGDVGAYRESLRRVRSLEPEVLVPMHGPPMTDPEARLEASLANVERTEARLLAFRDSRGRFYAREFVFEDLGVTGTRAPFLTLVVYEYLRHLADRGELSFSVTDAGILVTE